MTQMPIVDYLELGEPPHLVAQECETCGALYFDRRNACARCSGTHFARRALSNDGTVRAFTIVHRAAPNVPTPYTSVIVDLEGGGVVKANLVAVTDPEQITPRLPVTLATFPVGTDDDGVEAVAFGYRVADS